MLFSIWFDRAQIVTPTGVVAGAVQIRGGRIAAIRRRAPRGARAINLRGACIAPGFIDLHVWGDPRHIAREAVKHGTTAFLTTLGPEAPGALRRRVAAHAAIDGPGAQCLGLHLEGPFVNPARGGALPRRGMRAPTLGELNALRRASQRHLRMVTLAPELRGARAAIQWCRRHRIVASLGHSEADAQTAHRAVNAGASAVTHVFNGMRRLHPREFSLVDVALTDTRLATMVIADGVHVSPTAFRLLVRTKSPGRIALVTDSIRFQGWDVVARWGAYYRRDGTLAGSRLTMMQAVRHAVDVGGVSLADAVQMASAVPARLLGDRSRGALAVGRRADLVVFDRRWRVLMTIIGGRLVYQRKGV